MSRQFRIAMVGPLPPERSGIAEYSAGLVMLLRMHGFVVDTVTHADVQRQGAAEIAGKLREMDAVVYQMGNHPAFHGWMLPLLSSVPGIVHLHDLVLHHMAAGVLDEEQRLAGDDYPDMLRKWHSGYDVKLAEQALRSGVPTWNSDAVIDFPLHQVATKFATEVIVHSQYSAKRIAEVFPWLPIHVMPQLYPVVAPQRARRRLDTIAVLGGGHSNRRFDWIVQALTAIDADLKHPVTLEIAGEVEPAVQCVLDSISELGNIDVVNHGHVSDNAFASVFERADLMIALRQPTMGEASAVVSKAMQAGLPTIVSDHGWYAELPSCVRKIAPNDDCPAALALMLYQIANDRETFEKWAEECSLQAAAPLFDPVAGSEQYSQVIRNHIVFSNFRDRVATSVESLKVDLDSPLSSDLQRIDVKASLRGDRWELRAIAALGDQRLDSHARILSGTVGPYPYVGPLPEQGYGGQARAVKDGWVAVAPNSVLTVQVELTNNSEYQWVSPPGHRIRPYGIYLGHFWSVAGSTQPPVEQPRTWIDEPVDGTSSAVRAITVRAPDTPGEYCLEVDLVQESVCWFKGRGFIPARLQVLVEPTHP